MSVDDCTVPWLFNKNEKTSERTDLKTKKMFGIGNSGRWYERGEEKQNNRGSQLWRLNATGVRNLAQMLLCEVSDGTMCG
ncbi:hypothetical protein BCY88_35225 [Paraburkholderia fungorum]|uniref:Uncharacterized protein n=1 Tax=Paraburkholderia fungorum TaxID=134537 RepID=A0A3R7E3Z5_9BURK|nr:hypothetical protein BCY88_35225 [Paraburkholderia fungorum]